MFYINKLSNMHKFFILLLFFISGNSLAITEQEVIENIVPSNETLLVSTVQKQASALISMTDEEKKPDIWIESIAFFLVMQDQRNTYMIDTLLNEKLANNELLHHSESIAEKLAKSNKNCLKILGQDTRDENVLKLQNTLHNFIMNKMLIKSLRSHNYDMMDQLKSSVFRNHAPMIFFPNESHGYNYNSNDVLLLAMIVFLMKDDSAFGASFFIGNTGKSLLSTFDWNQPAVNAYRILTIFSIDKNGAADFFIKFTTAFQKLCDYVVDPSIKNGVSWAMAQEGFSMPQAGLR